MDDTYKKSKTGFCESVSRNLEQKGLLLTSVVNGANPVEERLFEEYGAVFLTKAKPPLKVMFEDETEVAGFQSSAGIASEIMEGETIELQPAAMEKLIEARAHAEKNGLTISPRDGAEAGRRSFEQTILLWQSRFEPALEHWNKQGRLSDQQVTRLRSLAVTQQVAEVLALEEDGIYFNTFFDNSILYSVAAPGTSQHLAMLAFDVTEYSETAVQKIMGDHGWIRTVQNDAPHFTYLGYREDELEGLGLKRVTKKDGDFWIPDL